MIWCGKHLPTKGQLGDREPGQNNDSSATKSSPGTPLALGFSKAKGMPCDLCDIIFKSGNPVFCAREVKHNSCVGYWLVFVCLFLGDRES